jgi:hypothetical protein
LHANWKGNRLQKRTCRRTLMLHVPTFVDCNNHCITDTLKTASGGLRSIEKMITMVLLFFIVAAEVRMIGTEDIATVNRTHSYKTLTGDVPQNTSNSRSIDT